MATDIILPHIWYLVYISHNI